MTTELSEKHAAIREKIAFFAEKEIACRDNLYRSDDFPHDIWHNMGKEKLLGMSLPEVYGGAWDDYLSILIAVETFVRRGRNIGLALTWIIHLIVSRFMIMGFGSKDQHKRYLEDLANGRITAGMAVSEPGTGANPKYIKTSGQLKGDSYILNGEKAFVTNGPIADLFIVFAVTGEKEGRNQITAFIVPKDAKGLSTGSPLELNFFRPSLHCGIKLANCEVSAHNILGMEGSAYEKMAKPFREIEEVLISGSAVGAMQLQIDLLIFHFQNQKIVETDEINENIGELQSLIQAVRLISYESARMIGGKEDQRKLVSLMLSSNALSKNFQTMFNRVVEKTGIQKDAILDNIINDLCYVNSMGKSIINIKKRKLGHSILSGKDVI